MHAAGSQGYLAASVSLPCYQFSALSLPEMSDWLSTLRSTDKQCRLTTHTKTPKKL